LLLVILFADDNATMNDDSLAVFIVEENFVLGLADIELARPRLDRFAVVIVNGYSTIETTADIFRRIDPETNKPLVDLILEHTHTCYDSVRGPRNDWGYGCGECPACDLRAKGWREWAATKAA
jgi:hypothetical protein